MKKFSFKVLCGRVFSSSIFYILALSVLYAPLISCQQLACVTKTLETSFIRVGWIKITIAIAITIVLINLITMDVIYPWDMVIDNDTVEYARYGTKIPYTLY